MLHNLNHPSLFFCYLDTSDEYGDYDYYEGDTLLSQPQQEDLLPADEEQVSKIEDAFADIAYHSCITFRPRETDDEHAVIILGSEGGCASTVGYNPDNDVPQYVKLADNCFGHGHEANFIKHSNESVSDFGVPYDYHSVMHYPDTAFTANGSQTVIPLKDNVTIGQREGLSHGDVLKLNRMYCEEAADEDKYVIDK
ncbi:hypothetical protein HF086_007726 [Spodoptera exigua]|uniref:Peptidase M12A domain-containing protein n=1 Tax=Spodoptera exigua TaxID=7107 RepID=A0A922SIK9_SPOEX|nr:hypothetical protein HF086_007726 [Spodoptera exigua]